MLSSVPLRSFITSRTSLIRQLSHGNRLQAKNEVLDEEGLPKDYKLVTISIISRRMDAVIHRAANMSRMDTEKAIARGNVRVNEKVVKKKSEQIEKNDEIDIWMSKYEDNIDLAHTKRLIVKNLTMDDKNGYTFELKYWKDLINYNWKEDIST